MWARRAETVVAMIVEGQRAPEFDLPADDGGTVGLRQLRGKTVIIYFYPRDDTPGCTTEACDFRDAFPRFAASGAVVIGVSPDDVASHRKFKAKFDLPFTLLADTDHRMATAYGVWKEKSMFGRKYMGVERTTVMIDKKGRVVKIFSKVQAVGHAAEVCRALAHQEAGG